MLTPEFIKENFMIRLLFSILFVTLLCSNSFAFELAQLQTETAEDLLLFFEEEELFIATRHKTPIKNAPAIATVITAKEIRNMGARNLMDILRKIPGIGVSISDIPVLHSIEVRGIKTTLSEKILVMIDGHKINTPVNGSAIWMYGNHFVDNIKRIEIIRGPGSALYGANAFVAAINIVTMDTEDIKGVRISAGGGSFDTERYNLLFGHEGERLKISGSFDYLKTDGASSFIEEDITGASGYTLDWKEKSNIGLNINYGDFTFRGSYTSSRTGPYIGVSYALNDESDVKLQHYYGDLSYSKDVNNHLKITARLYTDHFKNDPYWEIFPEGYLGIYTDGLLGNPTSKSSTTGSEISTDYEISDHLITTGIMYKHSSMYDTERSANFNPLTYAPLDSFQDITDWANYTKNADRNIWAIYLQDVWKVTKSASFTAGMRHDHYSDFGGTTNPRAGFVWEFIKDTSLKLLY